MSEQEQGPNSSEHSSEPETTPPSSQPKTEPETFPREYVEELRRENAAARVSAKRADELASRLLDATIASATAGILQDPEDVWRDREVDDFLDDDGYPDADKIRTIATELAQSKPHLAARKPSGDVGQGAREEEKPFSLADVLRSHA